MPYLKNSRALIEQLIEVTLNKIKIFFTVCSPVNSTKRSRPGEPVRKMSTTTPPVKPLISKSGRKSHSTSNLIPSQRGNPATPLLETADPQKKLSRISTSRERTKFDDLWQYKTIEHGLIRIPTHRLEDLIRAESIEKIYDVDEKPVAR